MNRRQYLQHFMVLLTGTAAAQVANLVSYPLLARLYSPADFGVFAMFVAVSAIPGAIACGRFDLAVPLAPRWGRHAILWLCVFASATIGALSAGGSATYWWWNDTAMGVAMPLLVGLCVFLTGFTAAASLYLMRHDRYRLSSASLVLRTGGVVAAQLGLAFVWGTPFALILGYAFGFALQGVLLALAIWTGQDRPPAPRVRAMRAMFRRYRRQVAIDIPSTFLAAVSLNLMTFLLLTLFDNRVVGFYALASRIAILPLQLFNDALGQVFFQKAARAQEERGEFWSEMKFNVLTSALLSATILVGIALFARPFIILYLGQKWSVSADMLLILAPMLALRSLCMSVATTVFVLRKPLWLFAHNVANAGVLLAAYAISWAQGLSVTAFLICAAVLLSIEYAGFAAILVWGARQQARWRTGKVAV